MYFVDHFFLIYIRSFSRSDAVTEKISLVTFDTAQIQCFGFETITKHHLTKLKTLECDGKRTALFDGIDFSLKKFKNLKTQLAGRSAAAYLIILTDGGSNFGRNEPGRVLWRTKKLHISGHIIQIGDTNSTKTRSMCDAINYKFHYFKGGNATDFVTSFSNFIETETRARLTSNPIALLEQLPTVPNTSVKMPSKQKDLA
jgi:hypothetical protein